MKKNEKAQKKRELLKKSPVLNAVNWAISITSAIGGIILLIGIYQEYQFRNTVDTSGLTKLAIDMLRQVSNWPYSITLIIVGIVILAVCTIAQIGIEVYLGSIINQSNQSDSGD